MAMAWHGRGCGIMAHDDVISRRVREAQARVFRVACDPMRFGLTLKLIAIDAGLPYSTLRGYAHGETEMPLSALVRLCGVLPAELLSVLLPDGWAISPAADEVCPDTLAMACSDFTRAHAEARHPASEDGCAISPAEAETLRARRAGLGVAK